MEIRTEIIETVLVEIVLDEIGLAIELGYLNQTEVLNTLQQRPISLDVILTGPSIPAPLIKIADQVFKYDIEKTEVRELQILRDHSDYLSILCVYGDSIYSS